MKFLIRMVGLLAVRGTLVAASLSGLLVLVTHLRLGGQSPGIPAIASVALRTWVPLVFIVIACWLIWTCARIVLNARQQASAAGLALLEYLDLPEEQKLQLFANSKVSD